MRISGVRCSLVSVLPFESYRCISSRSGCMRSCIPGSTSGTNGIISLKELVVQRRQSIVSP